MMRAIFRILMLSAIWALTATAAHAAAPPPDRPGMRTESRPPNAGKTAQEYQGLGADRRLATFAGTVLDLTDRPVDNVIVDLFIDGELAGTALTQGDGFYEIKIPYDSNSDTTVLLWYVPQSRSLLPKELVIRESKASRTNGLISRCIPRAALVPGHQFRVYLFDPANRNKDLAELNCLP
jgi:hypothetical protein